METDMTPYSKADYWLTARNSQIGWIAAQNSQIARVAVHITKIVGHALTDTQLADSDLESLTY